MFANLYMYVVHVMIPFSSFWEGSVFVCVCEITVCVFGVSMIPSDAPPVSQRAQIFICT